MWFCMVASMPYFYPRPPRGGRRRADCLRPVLLEISIHALREEGDCCCICIAESCCIFLSTPSARRATSFSSAAFMRSKFLSTPSARRATFTLAVCVITHLLFLSTPSARRATWQYTINSLLVNGFLSTPSARRATYELRTLPRWQIISIHALREEGDLQRLWSARRQAFLISIHALREEGDAGCACRSLRRD